jgi:Flp pilus assembly protein TadG
MMLGRFSRSERGTALIELTIILPLLVLFIIGAVEFGRVYYAAITVANAARAGAQFGTQENQSANFAGMTQAAQAEAADLGAIESYPSNFCRCPDGSAIACTGATCPGYGTPQVFVKDSVIKSITFLFKYPGLPQTVTVRRTATFRAQ